MDIEKIRNYCLNKPGTSEDFPFGDEVLVFRVIGKIFLLTNITQHPVAINLKCDPMRAVELRELYTSVQPGYHMNKKHWNTVTLDGTVAPHDIFEWIDHSYNLVAKSLKKAERELLSRPS